MPFVETRQGLVFLEGSKDLMRDLATARPGPEEGGKPDDQGVPGGGRGGRAGNGNPPADRGDKAAKAELKAFAAFVAKRAGGTWRDFDFVHLRGDDVRRLNDLGRVADLEGVKAAVAELTKAGSPKASARPEWPGWKYDLRLRDHYAPLLSQAFAGAWRAKLRNPPSPAKREPRKAAASDADYEAARSWLVDNLDLSPSEAVAVLKLLYGDGFVVGTHSAEEMIGPSAMTDLPLGGLVSSIDWDSWEPGYGAAADELLGEEGGAGLAELLAQSDVTIRSIAQTRIGDLARVLADGVRRGDTPETIARALEDLLDDPAWSRLVAQTEVTRAVTAATLRTYRDNGVAGKGVLTAGDAVVCALCQENEDVSPIPFSDDFPNDDPPTHPNCRCALEPYSAAEMDGEED
jgi:hypothetical protein